MLCWLERIQNVCISNGYAKQLAFNLGENRDDLVSRENNSCGLPFLLVVAAKARRKNSKVVQLAEGGLCSLLSIAARCPRAHVLQAWVCGAAASA